MRVLPIAIALFLIFDAYQNKYSRAVDEPSAYYADNGKTYILTFEPDWKDYLIGIAGNPGDFKFQTTLSETEKQITTENNADFIPTFVSNFKRLYPTDNLALLFSDDVQMRFSPAHSYDSVVFYVTEYAKIDLFSTKNILIARSDKMKMFSIKSEMGFDLNNFKLEFEHLINADDFKRKLLISSDVSFWEMYSQTDISDAIIRADDAIAASNIKPAKPKVSKAVKDSDIISMSDLKEENKEYPIRKYLLGGFESSTQSHNASISYVYDKDTAELMKVLNDHLAKNELPADAVFCFGRAGEEIRKEALVSILYCKKIPPNGRPLLAGKDIEDANTSEDKYSGMPVINIKMNAAGAKIWKKMTGQNVGKPIGIQVNNVIVSAPVPTEAITGGLSSITGAFTKQEAFDLAMQIKMGTCPVKVRIIHEEIK